MTAPGRSAARSPVLLRGGHVAAHVALVLVALGLGLSAAARLALITVAADSRVTATATAEEGPEHHVLQLADGRTLTVDAELFQRMGGADGLDGARLRTSAGERTAWVDGRAVDLRFSAASWRMIAALAGLLALGLVRAVRAGRAGDQDRSSRSGSTPSG